LFTVIILTPLDLEESDKPWRLPGADQTDYFNYGFDEFTWAAYCMKQNALREEAKEQKKQLGEMHNFLGNPAAPAANPAAGMMPNMGDIPPHMQQAIQSMMASGVDPNNMDFGMFMQMMNGGGQDMGAQAFGQQGQGQPHMGGYGFGGHDGRGGNRGRGRGRW
jgi:pre-mRNA 3'-end-processing factor FIP1